MYVALTPINVKISSEAFAFDSPGWTIKISYSKVILNMVNRYL